VIYWYSTTTSGTIFTNCAITTIISDFVISSTTTELNAVVITGNTLNFPMFTVS
jgi:hypothetical protein